MPSSLNTMTLRQSIFNSSHSNSQHPFIFSTKLGSKHKPKSRLSQTFLKEYQPTPRSLRQIKTRTNHKTKAKPKLKVKTQVPIPDINSIKICRVVLKRLPLPQTLVDQALIQTIGRSGQLHKEASTQTTDPFARPEVQRRDVATQTTPQEDLRLEQGRNQRSPSRPAAQDKAETVEDIAKFIAETDPRRSLPPSLSPGRDRVTSLTEKLLEINEILLKAKMRSAGLRFRSSLTPS